MKKRDTEIRDMFEENGVISSICEDPLYLENQIITYMGSKRGNLLNLINKVIVSISQKLNKKKISFLDGFSGSGIVSRRLKCYSSVIYANDIELYSKIVNQCYLSNMFDINIKDIGEAISFINAHKLDNNLGNGFIEELYSPQNEYSISKQDRLFYTKRNAKIIDNIRRMIEGYDNQYFFIAPLLSEASIHTNTSGVFKGFYKDKRTKIGQYGGTNKNALDRITREITLPIPVFSRYECEYNIYQEDINTLVDKIPEVDIAYYDPPYNQHPYGSNYFMLNLISEYKKPLEISRVSGIPTKWNRSEYNTKNAEKFIIDLFSKTKAKFILLSYSDEGIIQSSDIIKICDMFGKLTIHDLSHTVFRGCRNIQNRSSSVKEYIYVIEL